jgi:hypothetical protein
LTFNFFFQKEGKINSVTWLLRTGRRKKFERIGIKAYYQAFFCVLIDLIVELLGLIIKPFDNQTER